MNNKIEHLNIAKLIFLLFLLLGVPTAHAEVLDKVVAYVDDMAITWSDLEIEYQQTSKVRKNITKKETLSSMINKYILLREARLLNLQSLSDNEIITEYINLKIKSFITITDKEAEVYYNKNKKRFAQAGFKSVRRDIKKYLTEEEFNIRLRHHIEGLKEKVHVRILIDDISN